MGHTEVTVLIEGQKFFLSKGEKMCLDKKTAVMWK